MAGEGNLCGARWALGDGVANKASHSSCPRHFPGRSVASSSAWEHLASSLLVLHGWKRLRECGSDKQGWLKPGFPGHVLSLHLRPSPRQNLGTKRIFCPLQGSASHKNKLAETHVPGRGWEVGGTAQTASERNFHSVLRCLRQGFGSEEQILHQSLEEMHKTGRSGEQ